ncbi:MAG: Gfo/Idh/MocA family oxidoreductase [Lentisphaeria bacterium]|nr:Gfo/Idh/MocA family oxidoreductase [Lentisphaeria bacterium]
MGIKLGLVGLGTFGSAFAPLFASHPLVDSIVLCDAEADRIEKNAALPAVAAKLSGKMLTIDEFCRTDCDGAVVMTQPQLHAPQCIKILESGKYVYSAVPVISCPDDGEILDWCGKIIDTVQRTGMEYMLGETTIYRPQTMFCRRMARQGLFGDFVYAEAEYAHDLDSECSLREVQQRRSTGKIGEKLAEAMRPYREKGFKSHPMSYPTHSVSGVVDVMRSKPISVSAIGYRNANNDPYFKNYDFSNIVAFFRMDNGASFRAAEMREISSNIGLAGEDLRIFGTRGSYSLNEWRDNGRILPTPEKKPNKLVRYTPEEMRDPLPEEVSSAFRKALDIKDGDSDFVPSGHGGSHPYLVHEFVSAVAERRRPEISAWDAAMYMAMGVAAHKSACRDGEIVPVPDFGKTW